MKIISHINEIRFIVKEKGKCYLISIPKRQIFEIEDPNEIFRQGYWKEFKGDLDNEKKNIINDLIKNF